MTLVEVLTIAGTIIGGIVGGLTAIGLVWKGYHSWKKAISDEAYAKAKADQVLTEATRTIAQKDVELAAKTTALHEVTERERHLVQMTNEQRSIIQQLSSALERLGSREAVTE
jgi:predicted RNase H-like nuclease (RuvC/YqgF family)